jgi:hypothetical protein
MNTHDSERNIERILDSLEGLQRATPRPYFFTRIKARLEKRENGWSGITHFISRPAYALAMVVFVIGINVWIVYQRDDNMTANNAAQVATELPEEYNLAVNTFYNYDTP